jgi:WD40 repeat protein
VHKILFFPGTGHLLLSAGLDGLVKCWSVTAESRKLMRVYDGHTAAVRDLAFSNDGSRFLSASFDRYVRLWDTATGECLKTFTTRRVPYCVEFYPNDNNLFCVGQSDNKVVTMDATTGEITQEYVRAQRTERAQRRARENLSCGRSGSRRAKQELERTVCGRKRVSVGAQHALGCATRARLHKGVPH